MAYRKNPNLVQCPIHKLHYDESKQEGCALCLKAQDRIKKARQAKEKKASGLLTSIIAAVILGVVTWGVLFFVFPPTVVEDIGDEPVPFDYPEPTGWRVADRTQKEITLDRMGLRFVETRWSVPDAFTYHSGNPNLDKFIESIIILKGEGAIKISNESPEYLKPKLIELKPNSLVHPKVLDSEVLTIGDTQGVKFIVDYNSDLEDFRAWVFYIPAGINHYWIYMTAQLHMWDRFELTFTGFVNQITGGAQGEGEKSKLPPFLLKPYRAVLAGMFVFLISLWLITAIRFREEKKVLKKGILT